MSCKLENKEYAEIWRLVATVRGPSITKELVERHVSDASCVSRWIREELARAVGLFLRAEESFESTSTRSPTRFLHILDRLLYAENSPYMVWRRECSEGRRHFVKERIGGVSCARNIFVTSNDTRGILSSVTIDTPFGLARIPFRHSPASLAIIRAAHLSICRQQTTHMHGVISFRCPMPIDDLRSRNKSLTIEALWSKDKSLNYIRKQSVECLCDCDVKSMGSEGHWDQRDIGALNVFVLRRPPAVHFSDKMIGVINFGPGDLRDARSMERKLSGFRRLVCIATGVPARSRPLFLHVIRQCPDTWYVYFG